MPLKSFEALASIAWQLEHPIANFQPRRQGRDSEFATPDYDLGVFNNLYADVIPVMPGSPVTVDLYSFTNLLGDPIQFDRAVALFVAVAGDKATLAPGASNPFQMFFGSLTSSIEVLAGASHLFLGPDDSTGYLIDATHRNLKLTATGSGLAAVTLAVLGGDDGNVTG